MKKQGATILGTGLVGLFSILNFLSGAAIICGIVALLVGNSARGIELIVSGVVFFLIKLIAMFLVGGGFATAGACKKDEVAVKRYHAAAEQGNADAQYKLGYAYFTGEGVSQDYKEAVKWYRLAAEQGDASAQACLGVVYASGKGVPLDSKESVKWCRLAAEQGIAWAQFMLGEAYCYGKGVPQDDKEALKWYRLASEQGNADAQHTLGAVYEFGVPQDLVQAYAWYTRANISAQGDDRAVFAQSRVVEKMTPAQIEEGQRLSQEYAEKFIKK